MSGYSSSFHQFQDCSVLNFFHLKEKELEKMNELLRYKTSRRYFIISAMAKMAHACYFCLFPVFLYSKGFSLLDISVMGIVFTMGIVLLEVPTGIIADRIRIDWCIKLSYILMTIAYLVIFINQSYIVLVGANILMALSAAFSSGIIDVWLLDGLRQDGFDGEMTEVASFMQIVNNLGLTIGLLLGGIMTELSLKYAFTSGLALIVCANILCFLLVKNNNSSDGDIGEIQEKESIKKYLGRSIKSVTASFLCVSVSMAFIAFAIASPLNDHWQVFFYLRGIKSNFLLSNIYTIRTILIIVGGILAGKLTKKKIFDNLSLFRLGIACSAVALLVTALSQNWVISLLFWSIISITNTIARSFWTAELISTMDVKRRSTLFSVNSLIFSLGTTLGSLSIGKIAEVKGVGFGWIFCSCVMVVAILFSFIATVQVKKTRKESRIQDV